MIDPSNQFFLDFRFAKLNPNSKPKILRKFKNGKIRGIKLWFRNREITVTMRFKGRSTKYLSQPNLFFK